MYIVADKSNSYLGIDILSIQVNIYNDVVISVMASQITSLTIVYSSVFSGRNERKHQSPASLAVWGEFTGDR